MNDFLLTVYSGGKAQDIYADGEKTIHESLRLTDIQLDAPCGGRGVCGKCTVRLRGPVRFSGRDGAEYTDGEVCACRCFPAGDCEIWAESGEMMIAQTDAVSIKGGGNGLGLAVDLGTTTLAAAVYELQSGRLIKSITEPNAQRIFGADVVSRTEHCLRGGLNELLSRTDAQLRALADDNAEIRRVAIVGNTVMQHLALGLDPSDIAVPPFEPQSLFGEHTRSEIWKNADVYAADCVSGYVGGDVLAGMLAVGLHNATGLHLYIDIGTNGEIALGDKNGFVTCATAAGPAFEGAEIFCGMTASDGAIDRVYTEDGDIRIRVIGESDARGICGSGITDAAAVLLELGLINSGGRFVKTEKAPEHLRERFGTAEGVRAFYLTDSVCVTQHDIRRVQLAKAAIRAGAEVLLNGRAPDSITVAGGFGKQLDIRSAVRIGLLPEPGDAPVIQAGNAAAKGAALLLTDGADAELSAFAKRCSYTDLSSSAEFSRRFIEALDFC